MPKRKTHEEFAEEVFELVGNEYSILEKYKNSATKILMKHEKCNYEYRVGPSKFLIGHRCPKCFGNKLKTTSQFKEEVHDLVGEEYVVLGEYESCKTKIKMWHKTCNHVYSVKPNDFLQGRRCPNCFGKTQYTTNTFKNKMFELAGDEYSLLSSYQNTSTKVEVKHNTCGNVYKVTPQKFVTGRRCPICSDSKGAKIINDLLKSNNVNFIREYRIDDCRNILPLPFDFAIFDDKNELSSLIEFDGVQHYIPSFGERSFKITQRNDKIKDKYCKDNNIRLIRVPHFKIDEVNNIVNDVLVNL